MSVISNFPIAPSLQSKSVNIASNGTTSVSPDSGYDGLSDVSITTNVSSATGTWVTVTMTSFPPPYLYAYDATLTAAEITEINSWATEYANSGSLTLYARNASWNTSIPSTVTLEYFNRVSGTSVGVGAWSATGWTQSDGAWVTGNTVELSLSAGGGGTDVSDTTAVASDVVSPKVFHIADGTLTTGSITDYRSASSYGLSSITYSVSAITGLLSAGAYGGANPVVIPEGTIATAIGLTASEIVSGNTVLGVIGTGGGGSVSDAIVILTRNASGYPTTIDASTIPKLVGYDFYSATTFGYYYVTSMTLPTTLTTIPQYAFYYCYNLNFSALPSNVASIGNYAFYNCHALSLTALPSLVTSIGTYAFYGCSNLALTELPSTTTSIGQRAFYNCSSLGGATQKLKANCTSISTLGFRACTNLRKVWIPSTCTTITAASAANSPFYACNSALQIYTDAASANTGWEAYWNYYSSSGQLTVNYGTTEAQFDAL